MAAASLENHELPFTTEYGKFWKPWQAFRELEANTRDENGATHEWTNEILAGWRGDVNHTFIIVDHPEFYEAWQKRDEVFLPGASSKISSTQALEVFAGECQHLYYRGMKVYDLSQESMFTYNILKEIDLTEDRTIKYEFEAKQALGDFVAKSEDRAFVEKIVTAPEDTWEHSVDFAQWQRPKPSKVFQEVVRSKPAGLLPTVQAHHDYWEPPRREVVVQHVEQAHPKPWKIVADWIEDANGTNIFQKPYGYRGNWARTAQMVIDTMNPKSSLGKLMRDGEVIGSVVSITLHSEEPVVEEKIDEPPEPQEFVQPNADDEVPF